MTGDDSMYLMTEEMKEKRNELEHRKFQQFFPSGNIPDPSDLEIQLNAATMAFVLEPFDKLQPVAGVDSHLTSRTGSGKTSRHQVGLSQSEKKFSLSYIKTIIYFTFYCFIQDNYKDESLMRLL